jgi:hypothetical protein
MTMTWQVSPRAYILLIITVLVFISGVIGIKDIKNQYSKIRSLITLILTGMLVFLLFLGAIRPLIVSEDLITTTHSPNGNYTVKLYLTNGGATTSFGITGYLEGPLWFKKIIYDDYKTDQAEVHWLNNNTVSINRHKLNLNKGQTYNYQNDPTWHKEHDLK